MILSTSSEYALKVVFYLIENKSEAEYSQIKHISEELDLSYYLLAKVANVLIRKNILSSFKGPTGGIKIAIDPSKLTIMEIIKNFSDPALFSKCVLGLSTCDPDDPCAIHFDWLKTKTPMLELFNKPLNELNGLNLHKDIKLTK